MNEQSTANDGLEKAKVEEKVVPAVVTDDAKPRKFETEVAADGTDPIANLRKSFLGLDKPRVPTEKKEAKPAKPAEQKPAETPKAAASDEQKQVPASKPVEKPEQKPAEQPKVRKVAKETVTRIEGVEALAETAKALQATAAALTKTPEAPKAVERKLPARLEKKIPDLKILAETKPELKDIVEKTREFYGEGGIEDQYKAKWERENPGVKFDENDDAHADFYEKNEPYVDPDDLEDAKLQRVERKFEEKTLAQKEEIKREVMVKQARENAVPIANRYSDAVIKQVASALNPELANVEADKWIETDPLAVDLIMDTHKSYIPVAAAVAELRSGVPFDKKNPVHVQVSETANELEEALLEKDPDQLVIGNKSFATRQQYKDATEAQRKKLWVINDDLILGRIGQYFEAEVRSKYDRYSKYVPKGGAKSGHSGAAATTDKGAANTDEHEEKSTSPSVVSSAPAPTSASAGKQSSASDMPNLRKGFLGM